MSGFGFELGDGTVDAALQLLAGQFGEPAFDRMIEDPEVGVKWICHWGRRANQALTAVSCGWHSCP